MTQTPLSYSMQLAVFNIYIYIYYVFSTYISATASAGAAAVGVGDGTTGAAAPADDGSPPQQPSEEGQSSAHLILIYSFIDF